MSAGTGKHAKIAVIGLFLALASVAAAFPADAGAVAQAAPQGREAPGGKAIPYALSGEGKETVWFIHGFMDAGNVWEPVVAQMDDLSH